MSNELPRFYTFEQAIEAFFPNTGLVAGDLLAAYRKKRLRITKIGHRKLVTEAQILAMIKRCQDSQEDPISPSKTGGSAGSGTSSGTEGEARLEQDALRAEIGKIKGLPRNSNSANTSPRSTKSKANVVPLRSV